MTTLHQQQKAFAATVPMALTGIADHIVNHQLPTPAQTIISGPIVGQTTPPAVQVLLDARDADDWTDSLEAHEASVHTEHADGTWHDVHGVANAVRVRLSWYTVNTSFAPAPAPVLRLNLVVDHESCRSTDCEEVLCYCRDGDRCRGTVEPACSHREPVCETHRMECSECLGEAKAEAGVTGW